MRRAVLRVLIEERHSLPRSLQGLMAETIEEGNMYYVTNYF